MAGIGQFVVGEPTVESVAKGRQAVVLPYSDVMRDLYGNVSVTTTGIAREQPDLAKRSIAALTKGLVHSIGNPDETGRILQKNVPAAAAAPVAAELTLMSAFVRPEGSGNVVGTIDTKRVAGSIELLQDADAMPAGFDPRPAHRRRPDAEALTGRGARDMGEAGDPRSARRVVPNGCATVTAVGWPALGLARAIGGWWLITSAFPLVHPAVLPPPAEVLTAFRMKSAELLGGLTTTTLETVAGFRRPACPGRAQGGRGDAVMSVPMRPRWTQFTRMSRGPGSRPAAGPPAARARPPDTPLGCHQGQ